MSKLMPRPSEDHLAAYAVRSSEAGGRAHREPDDPLRSPFALDRHRIIESTAFRRLERKTQVFAASHHDHFRTRLTHTLEAAQIGRCLAAGLGANGLLVEAITLAHDLGHPPFGHAGEVGLDEAMTGLGGFNHNTHSRRVVEYLEHPFPPFRGLNLTAETLAGIAAHATRYDRPAPGCDITLTERCGADFPPHDGPHRVKPVAQHESASYFPQGASVEAQIASAADRIAFNCHDLEDAIGAEFINLDQLAGIDLWQSAYERVTGAFDVAHVFALRRTVLDAMLNGLLVDVIETSRRLLEVVHSPAEAREAASKLSRAEL